MKFIQSPLYPFLLGALLAVSVNFSYGQSKELIPFDLEDQFDKSYSDSDFRGKTIVMIGSDGGGSDYNSRWGTAIHDNLKKSGYKDEVNWVAVADLRGVPFFMKGYVRKQFSSDKKEWVLLDWDGLLAEAYNFQSGNSNILIFNRNGKLLYKTKGKEVDSEEVNTILGIIMSS